MEYNRLKSGTRYREKIQINGRIHKSSWYRRKTDAKTWKAKMVTERDKLKHLGVNLDVSMTVDRYCHCWVLSKKGKSLRTIDSYTGVVSKYIIPYFGSIKLIGTNPQLGEAFKLMLLETNLSVSRVNFIITVLKMIFKDAVKSRMLLRSPFEALEFIKVQRKRLDYWSPEEIKQFLEVNQEDHYYPFYLFLLNTGCRKGESMALHWDCVNFSLNQIEISRNLTRHGIISQTKSRVSRHIPINNEVREMLKNLYQQRTSEFVFTRPNGTPMDYHHFTQRQFYKAVKRANVKKIKLHGTRVSFACAWVSSGLGIYSLSKILGHHSVEITEASYSHLSNKFLQSEVNSIGFSSVTGPKKDLQLLKGGLTY